MAAPRFTVCALFYGDFPKLCRRLLDSLYREAWLEQIEVRIGCNACSLETMEVIRGYTGNWVGFTGPGRLLASERTWWSEVNIHKYPMMRRMFYDRPVTTPYVMWFDDDSWIKPSAPDTFFKDIADFMENPAPDDGRRPDMIGSIWQMRFGGNQYLWIQDQPWYTGKPVSKHQIANFATGGWWTVRYSLLEQWNWPDPQVDHNGGDAMLGELIRQQGYKIRNYDRHLAINADESEKCSSAPRRGTDQFPVGWHYQPGPKKTTDDAGPPSRSGKPHYLSPARLSDLI